MVWLFTNITDGLSTPRILSIYDIDGRTNLEVHPGETIDLEVLSNRNQICQSLHIRSHVAAGWATIDTLGTDPECRTFVDAKITGGDIIIENVQIEEPIQISALVEGIETGLTAKVAGDKVALNVDQIYPEHPTIVNIPILNANEENIYALPIDTRRFQIRVKDGPGIMNLSFASGGEQMRLYCGTVYKEEDIDAGNITLFFETENAPKTVEVLSWSL